MARDLLKGVGWERSGKGLGGEEKDSNGGYGRRGEGKGRGL